MKQALEIIKNMRSGYGDDYHTGKEWRAMEALRQAIKQAEKEATLQEISDIGQEAHTDHPMRHWDRTCPACVAEAEKQEPVAWLVRDYVDGFRYVSSTENPSGTISGLSEPLYTAPPKREWIGLTEEEIKDMYNKAIHEITTVSQFVMFKTFARAIEAKLKEKNT
jgi:hypothetical protein